MIIRSREAHDIDSERTWKDRKRKEKNNLGICRATSCSRSACTPARFIPVWCLQRMQKLCRRRSHLAMWKNRRRTVHRLRPISPFIRMGQWIYMENPLFRQRIYTTHLTFHSASGSTLSDWLIALQLCTPDYLTFIILDFYRFDLTDWRINF